jgi:hypothetical protein
MKVNKQSWHAKVYNWHHKLFNDYETDSSNLCPYVRTVFIWAPLLWVFIVGKVIPKVYNGFIWLAAIISGLSYWGYTKNRVVFWGVLVVIATAVTIAGLAVGLVEYAKYRRTLERNRLRELMTAEEWDDYRWAGRLPVRLRAPATNNPIVNGWRRLRGGVAAGVDLLRDYASATHDKICPLIEIK